MPPTPDFHNAMPPHEKWRHEKELLGFYVTGHPLEPYGGLLEAINSPAENRLQEQVHQATFRLCGVLQNLQKRFTQRIVRSSCPTAGPVRDQRPWATFDLETRDRVWAMNCFPDTYERVVQRLSEGDSFVVQGSVRRQNGEIRLSVSEIQPLAEALPRLITEIHWDLDSSAADLDAFLDTLHDYTQEPNASCALRLLFHFPDEERSLEIPLPLDFRCPFELPRLRQLEQQFRAVRRLGIRCRDLVRAPPWSPSGSGGPLRGPPPLGPAVHGRP